MCARSRGLQDCRACTVPVCALRGTAETICPLRAGSEGKEHWVWRVARHLEGRGAPCRTHPPIPLRTLMRLRWYCAALERFEEQGLDVISSRDLAEQVGVGSAMVRKDFSHVGDMGTPGLGYHVSDIKARIHKVLEGQTCHLAWVGARWLGNLLASFAPAVDINFRIVAAFDTSPEWIGQKVGPYETRPLADLPALLAEGRVDGVVLALPEEATRVADLLIAAGVKGILNLTPVMLTPPPGVNVRHVDLIGEMMALAMEVADGAPVADRRKRSGPAKAKHALAGEAPHRRPRRM